MVVVIASVLLTLSIPAYQALIRSSERTLATSALQNGVRAAQDIALAGDEGEDGAIVFLHDDRGRIVIVPAVKIGTYENPVSTVGGSSATIPGGGGAFSPVGIPTVTVDVFVPTRTSNEIQLPRFWSVRGYAAPGSLNDRVNVINPPDSPEDSLTAIWYNSPMYTGGDLTADVRQEGHWVFPETSFFARDAQHEGAPSDGDFGQVSSGDRTPRQSFMIRFDGRTGQLRRDAAPAIFVDPRLSNDRPYGDVPGIEDRWKRVDLSEDLRRWAERVLTNPDIDGNGNGWQLPDTLERAQLISNASHDTVLLKPVTRIALYDEREFAGDIGARRLNPNGTIYEQYDQDDSTAEILVDEALWAAYPGDDVIRTRINRWIEGDTNDDGVISFDDPDDEGRVDNPLSRVYLVQPYSAQLVEVIR